MGHAGDLDQTLERMLEAADERVRLAAAECEEVEARQIAALVHASAMPVSSGSTSGFPITPIVTTASATK